MVALIAQRSKYDFWIPDEILTLEIKIQIKKYFFEIENVDRKKIGKKMGPKNFPIQKWSKTFPDFFRSKFSISKKIDLNLYF